MSEMNSFYGGRQGASFVIVKRFDGLDIPENTVYRYKVVALTKEVTPGEDPILCIAPDPATGISGPVERNADNYTGEGIPHFGIWGYAICDGATQYIGIDNKYYTFGDADGNPIYAEGMKQCFEKGGETISEVGYGEYVLIDTIFGLGEFTNPDNGKVYRRGMRYDDDLGGAEFIGQIVGPKGSAPELEMHTVKETLAHTESSFRQYEPKLGGSLDGITPGHYFSYVKVNNPSGRPIYNQYAELYQAIERTDYDTIFHPAQERLYEKVNNYYVLSTDEYPDTSKVYYDCTFLLSTDLAVDNSKIYYAKKDILNNDTIDYSWATVRDNHGNIIGAWIGFKFPYLVPEVEGSYRSPYYTQEDYDLGRINDVNLIGTSIKEVQHFNLFVDNGLDTIDRDPNHGDTGHPYYRKWKLTFPKGIKGDTQTQLEIIPTKMREGSNLWSSTDFTQEPVDTADAATYVIVADDPYPEDCIYPYDNTSTVVTCYKESAPTVKYYAKIEDTYMLTMRYRETNYDEHVDGDYQIINIGDYNTIRYIWLTQDGWLWVRYNADEDGIINREKAIQWVIDTDFDDEGNLVFTYNTLKEDGVTHNTEEFPKSIDWVESVALANRDDPTIFDPKGTNVNSGHFRIIFNNDSVANKTGTWDDGNKVHAIWETDITWPKSVSLTDEGLLKFLYNNNLYYDPTIYTDAEEGSYSYTIPWITGVLIEQNGTFTLSYNNEVNKHVYFYQVEEGAEFDEEAVYYTLTGDNYIIDPTVTEENFEAKVAAGLYLGKGDDWNTETHTWTKVLNFIDHVTIDDDGTIHFWYSNGKEADNSGYENIRIKYLKKAIVDTGLVEDSQYQFEGEGTGDQKITLTWNTEEVPGVKDVEKIGAPINYIMEALVTTYDPNAPDTPQNHMIVLYSDPVYRQFLVDHFTDEDIKKNKIWTYTSQKFTEENSDEPYTAVTPVGDENPSEQGWYELVPIEDTDPVEYEYVLTEDEEVDPSKTYYQHNIKFVTRDDWFDLGYVKGEPGGLHIIGSIDLNPGETYADYLDDAIPPEKMPGNTFEDRGWAYMFVNADGVTRTLYTYDYLHDKWVKVPDFFEAPQAVILDRAVLNPDTGKEEPETDIYKEAYPFDSGLWFVKSDIKAAY